MLSIGVMQGGQQNYYVELARQDYYINGGEPSGIWHGKGARDLGLFGFVDGEALTRLFEGFHPRDDRALIQIQNCTNREHRPGWDLTFSAPKTVSVLWSQADQKSRRLVQQAHFSAVKAALDYLEDEIAVTRFGRGGAERKNARLIIATFEHHTSRAEDPNLHTHALVLNVCTDTDGHTRTLESRQIYLAKMAAGALYRAEFAAQIERVLHLTIERKGSVFEIAGVAEPLTIEMSKRRAEIEKVLAESGYSGAAASATVALRTRGTKSHVAQEELSRRWQEVGRAFGWGPEQAARLIETARPRERDAIREMQDALANAADRATEHQSFFSAREFTRYLAEEATGRGIGAMEIRKGRDAFLAGSDEIVRLGRHKGEFAYTTREMVQEEKRLLDAVEESKTTAISSVSERTVENVIATRREFGDEQAHALRHITRSGGSIRVVSGMAGTGKTTLLEAARLAWELEDFEVRGAALAGKAAEGLSTGAGIQSETLKRTLFDIRHGRINLHERTVLVIDESGMVGTRMMRELVEATRQSRSRLVLVGDAQQLQPIEAGGPFSAIIQQLGAATLVDIKRQREAWAREAVKDFAHGEAASGLRAYAERGLVFVADDRRKAMEALVAAWKEKGVRNPEEQLILAGSRKEAAILNRMAQAERVSAGLLVGDAISVAGSNDILYNGDRILFTRKSRLIGVENGSCGKVVAIDPTKGVLTVRLDGGAPVRFSLAHYADVKPGYAMTTHKGQGATTEWSFVLAGGAIQDREISNVQVSRARAETKIFTDVEEAGEMLTRLVKQMSLSRQKIMAHDIERQRAPREEYSQDMGL